MALARSMSGPGGLSINTSSANSLFGSNTTPAAGGGMFGSAQASKPTTGLFGSTTTTSAPQTGGLFGSTPQTQGGGLFDSNTTTSQAPSGGLFGTTTTTQPQAGGLFGPTTNTTQPQTGGLFGSTQPQQTGGLFGSTTTTTQPQTTGLFGSTMNSQPQQTGGLFSNPGQPAAQNPGGGLFGSSTTQPAQGGGLFGGLNNQNQNKPATGLFGSLGSTQNQQPQQNQPQQSSMFSSLGPNQNQGAQNQGSGLFGNTIGGGLSLGQSNNQQQQTVPGVTIDMTNIRSTTRFGDLHEDIKKGIESIDAVIQDQIQMKNQCDAIMSKHNSQLAQIPHDVEFCQRKLIGVQNAGAGDVYSINLVKKYIETDVQNAKLSFKAIDNLKLPPQYHTSNIWSAKSTSSSNQSQSNGEGGAHDIVSFFSSTADELATTLASYQKHIIEIEQHLRGVEANSAAQLNTLVAKRNGSFTGIDDPMEQLTGALRDFEESLLGVAANVGAAREGVQGLQLGRFQGPTNGAKKGPRSGVY
ncbi:hypothetical protein N431DRAFT_377031 [Stipitochalara longipes BDJ]|nr:hypothetical protein N431DRAFT_377031 [Stipitochalara longipes BDJ]